MAARWYAIQVTSGREELAAEELNRALPASAVDEPVFYPKYRTQAKRRGVFVDVEKPLFSGYLLAVSRNPAVLQAALRDCGCGEWARLLTCADGPAPLVREEVEVLGGLTSPGARTVPMSVACKEGDEVVVVEGPLAGHEGLIREINRHRSTAYLELDFCGRKVGARVGVAVLGEASEAAARAAHLVRKAAA